MRLARGRPGWPARVHADRRRAAADALPGAVQPDIRRRVSRRGGPELSPVLPGPARPAQLAGSNRGACRCTTYDGLYLRRNGSRVRQPDGAPSREGPGHLPAAEPRRLRPRGLSASMDTSWTARRPPRSSPRWAARSAATSARGRSSAISSAAGTWTRSSRRSSRSGRSATTACGSRTTTSRSTSAT